MHFDINNLFILCKFCRQLLCMIPVHLHRDCVHFVHNSCVLMLSRCVHWVGVHYMSPSPFHLLALHPFSVFSTSYSEIQVYICQKTTSFVCLFSISLFQSAVVWVELGGVWGRASVTCRVRAPKFGQFWMSPKFGHSAVRILVPTDLSPATSPSADFDAIAQRGCISHKVKNPLKYANFREL